MVEPGRMDRYERPTNQINHIGEQLQAHGMTESLNAMKCFFRSVCVVILVVQTKPRVFAFP